MGRHHASPSHTHADRVAIRGRRNGRRAGHDRQPAPDQAQRVGVMVQQADAFGLDRAEVGVAGIDPDRDLLQV